MFLDSNRDPSNCSALISVSQDSHDILTDLIVKFCSFNPYFQHKMDVVITTPPVMVDLLNANKINFKRLCHLILEDGTKLFHQHYQLVDKILRLVDTMLKNRKFLKTVQFVVCAEHWDFRLQKLLGALDLLPSVCIGNYLEASLYGGVQFSIQFVDSSCKDQELISK